MSETAYNLAINEGKRNLAIVQRELSEAIIERDKVLNEINDQRNSNSIVTKDVTEKVDEKV
jgi:ribosome-binding protein aMBF1 (putative translation factor)